MHVYPDSEGGFEKPRLHPFKAKRLGEAGYVDFKSEPHRIAEVLEDFVPLAHIPAVQRFYRFLAWLNGPDSVLESCDSALRRIGKNDFPGSRHSLCVHGRLMLMYRDLSANCDDRFNLLYNGMGRELSSVDPELAGSQGNIGLSGSPALYRDLVPADRFGADGSAMSRLGDPGRGYQLLLLFKAFGDDPVETFNHLDRVFENIQTACQRLTVKLAQRNSPSAKKAA